jgi:hypothetical protein
MFESNDNRVNKSKSANYELRMALKQCREQLERLEELLLLSKQDNRPSKYFGYEMRDTGSAGSPPHRLADGRMSRGPLADGTTSASGPHRSCRKTTVQIGSNLRRILRSVARA